MVGIANGNMVANVAHLAGLTLGILFNHPVHAGNQGGPVPVHGQHIGNLGAQTVVNLYLAATRFTQNRHFHAVTKRTRAVTQKEVYILNISMLSNHVIGHIVGHVLNEGIVPHRHVVQRAFPQTGMLLNASRQGEDFLESAKFYSARKTDATDVIQGFGGRCKNGAPVFCPAASLLQQLNLSLRKGLVSCHILFLFIDHFTHYFGLMKGYSQAQDGAAAFSVTPHGNLLAAFVFKQTSFQHFHHQHFGLVTRK